MSWRLCSTVGLFLLFAAGAGAQTSAEQRAIQVEINYTGAGTVDGRHKIYVALWDSSDLSGGPPAAVRSLDSKKGTVTFSIVQKVPAFVSAAYDPTGAWDAQSPPPSGSSLGMYSKNPPNPEAIDVAPGQTVKVSITFDDSAKVPLLGTPDYPNMAGDFARTFRVLNVLPCDVFGAQHPYFVDMEAKVARLNRGGANPFVDPAGYRAAVAEAEAAYLKQLATERARM